MYAQARDVLQSIVVSVAPVQYVSVQCTWVGPATDVLVSIAVVPASENQRPITSTTLYCREHNTGVSSEDNHLKSIIEYAKQMELVYSTNCVQFVFSL